MKKFKKIFFLLILVNFLTLIIIDFCFAQGGRPVEIEYPIIHGLKVEATTIPLADYVKYIFYFAIAISGLLAFGALIYGGVRYLTSAGNPAAVADAKDQIFAGILGLIILLSSYLVLNTINPQLVVLKTPELSGLPQITLPSSATGTVLLYAEKEYQNPVAGYPSGGGSMNPPASVVKSVKIEKPDDAVIFHALTNYGGSKICFRDSQADLTLYSFDFGKIVPPFGNGDITDDIQSLKVITNDKCLEPGIVFAQDVDNTDPILLYRGQDWKEGIVLSYSSIGQVRGTKTPTEINSMKIKDPSLAVRFYEKVGYDDKGKMICFKSPGFTKPPCIGPRPWWCPWCSCDTWEDNVNSLKVIPASECPNPGQTISPP